MTKNRLPFLTWCILFLGVFGSLLYAWITKNQLPVETTAFQSAQREILANANNFKQNWLLNNGGNRTNIEGGWYFFTPKGWTYGQQETLDCSSWLSTLWPQKTVFGREYEYAERLETRTEKRCDYFYPNGHKLMFVLKDDVFMVEIDNIRL